MVDLFSKQEIAMMAKRLKIAKLLLEGEKYEAIGARLKVGTATIARIRAWLDEGGSGFRFVYQKTKHKKNPLQQIFLDEPHWRSKYCGKELYFWPSMLLEEISRSASKRQRNRLISILEDIPKKQKIHHDLISIFQGSSSKIRTNKHHNKGCRNTFIL